METKKLIEVLMSKGILDQHDKDVIISEESCKVGWARHIVENMHHTHNGMEYSGEKYTMYDATELYNEYKHQIPVNIKPYHVYIAINAQYHDYCPLFKDWGLDNLDCKIKTAAMSFWFMDEDYEGCKIEKYFMK